MKTVIDAVNELKGEWPCDMLKVECPGFTCTVDQFADKVCIMMLNYGGCSELEFSHYASASKTLLTKDLDKELDMDIDWSKAPEGATHLSMGSENFPAYYYKLASDGLMLSNEYTNGWVHSCNANSWLINNDSLVTKSQPTPTFTKEMSDNGVLPSVGMECRVVTSTVTIGYVGNNFLVLVFPDGSDGTITHKEALEDLKPLTPPKTDKEKLIEEFQNALHDAFGTHTADDWSSIEDIASDLFDSFLIQPLTVEVK
tara:strand:- start:548 stop:1315 length:768 start_codon:yes stop_codon:yes gene_type:complete